MGTSRGQEGKYSYNSIETRIPSGSQFSQAEESLRKDPKLIHEYLPIAGIADFTTAAQKLMLGADSPAIKDKRVNLQTQPSLRQTCANYALRRLCLSKLSLAQALFT